MGETRVGRPYRLRLRVVALCLVGLLINAGSGWAAPPNSMAVTAHGPGLFYGDVQALCRAWVVGDQFLISGKSTSRAMAVASVSCRMNGGPWTMPIPTGLGVANGSPLFVGCLQDACPPIDVVQYVTYGTAPLQGDAANLCVRLILERPFPYTETVCRG